MMDRAASAGGDEWIRRCLSILLPLPSLDSQGLAAGFTDVLTVDSGDGIASGSGPPCHSLSAPSASYSGSLTRECFSFAGPPSDLNASGLTADCVIAPPAERFDGQGDDSVRPGRRLHRNLVRIPSASSAWGQRNEKEKG